jgi:hypothetical protein
MAPFSCDKETIPVNGSESRALNTLLRGLGIHTPPWDDGPPIPTSEQAMTAAAMLADRANKPLGAGLRGGDVRGCWPHLQAVHDHLNCQVCGRAKVRDGGGYFVCPDDSDEHRERQVALARQTVHLDSSSMGAWPEGDLAYDGSQALPTRELTAREHDVLCRVISLVAHDPWYQHEEITGCSRLRT